MLDRILNIKPQDKYKNGLKVPSNHAYIVNRYDQERQNSRDSALFSPLAKLLSKINWKILNIEYPSDEEMLFNFLVNDIEFITLINFSEMYTKLYQEFSIFKPGITSAQKKQYEAKLKVEKYDISILDSPNPIETNNLSILMKRVQELHFNDNLQINGKEKLNNLINMIDVGINSELNYILKVIYTFMTTRSKSRVKNNFILKTNQNIPIIMQKVAIIYAD